jgi:hypothetical protein
MSGVPMQWMLVPEITQALRMLGVVCALIVLGRAVLVLNALHWKGWGRQVLRYAGFGLSYVALGMAAAGSGLAVLTTTPTLNSVYGWAGFVLWCVASAGLILFDRRPAPQRQIEQQQSLREVRFD